MDRGIIRRATSLASRAEPTNHTEGLHIGYLVIVRRRSLGLVLFKDTSHHVPLLDGFRSRVRSCDRRGMGAADRHSCINAPQNEVVQVASVCSALHVARMRDRLDKIPSWKQ